MHYTPAYCLYTRPSFCSRVERLKFFDLRANTILIAMYMTQFFTRVSLPWNIINFWILRRRYQIVVASCMWRDHAAWRHVTRSRHPRGVTLSDHAMWRHVKRSRHVTSRYSATTLPTRWTRVVEANSNSVLLGEKRQRQDSSGGRRLWRIRSRVNTQGVAPHTCTGAPLGAPWGVSRSSQGCLCHLEARTS